MYLTYDEYTAYGGALDETTFNDIEYDAESTINWYTFNRLKRPEWASALDTDELKRCVYQLVKMKQIEDSLLASSIGGGENGWGFSWHVEPGITQESNDGVLTSYNTLSSGQITEKYGSDKAKFEVVNKYLGSVLNDLGRRLLYKGVYPGE